MKRLVLLALACSILAIELAPADAQNRPRPRPPWEDVCCGGPCCRPPGR